MRVMVTGATGFVGSHTARALLAAGHAVTVLARDRAKAVRVLGDAAALEIVEGDLLSPEAVRKAVEGTDAVVHSAGLVALDERRADEVRRVNLEGTRLVLQAGLDAGVRRVVHVSSTSVFALGAPRIGLDAPLATATGAYARSKRDADELARGLQASGAPIAITYPSGVHGPGSPELTDGHRATMLWLNSVLLTSSGTAIVDVRDVAAAHVALAEGAPFDRVLLGGHFLRWAELRTVLQEVTGRRIPAVPFPGPLLRACGRIGDLVKRVVPFGFPLTLEAMTSATRSVPFDSDASCAALGLTFRPVSETLTDEIRWLAGAGHVAGRLAGGLADATPGAAAG
jgi:nucleoside-diphosphate-sugar epimerase